MKEAINTLKERRDLSQILWLNSMLGHFTEASVSILDWLMQICIHRKMIPGLNGVWSHLLRVPRRHNAYECFYSHLPAPRLDYRVPLSSEASPATGVQDTAGWVPINEIDTAVSISHTVLLLLENQTAQSNWHTLLTLPDTVWLNWSNSKLYNHWPYSFDLL